MSPLQFTAEDQNKFTAYLAERKQGDNECWICGGGHTYGSFSIGGKIMRTHRVSWMIANQTQIPDGMNVLHKCDNPPCANPRHLFLGTQKENIADMMQKGRQGKQRKPTRDSLGLPRRVTLSLHVEPSTADAFKLRAKSEGKSFPALLDSLLKQ